MYTFKISQWVRWGLMVGLGVLAGFCDVLAQNQRVELVVTGEASGGHQTTIAQVEKQARADAMRKALEQAGVYLTSVTEIDLAEITRDEVAAWTRGLVRVLEVLTSETTFDAEMKAFRCQVKLKVEVRVRDMDTLMTHVKQARVAETVQAPELAFEYRFMGSQSGLRGVSVPRHFAVGDVVQGGDAFQIWFRPDRDCYAYVINRDASGAVYVLFPHAQAISNRLVGGRGYTLPGDDQAYRFDDVTGTETFYLVVSPVEMADLEWMIARMGNGHDGAVAAMLDGTLRARGLRGAGIVTSGGKSQMKMSDGGQVTQMFKGRGVMVQTFTLDHR